jgi:hypothetical protein
MINFVGFEVLTAVTMKSAALWDLTPQSPIEINQRFRETYCLLLQGRKRKKQEISKKQAISRAQLAACFLLVPCCCVCYIYAMKVNKYCEDYGLFAQYRAGPNMHLGTGIPLYLHSMRRLWTMLDALV